MNTQVLAAYQKGTSNNPDRVDYKCAAYRRMRPLWDRMDDIAEARWIEVGSDGKISPNEKAKTYLPKWSQEAEDAYKDRFLRTPFRDKYGQANNSFSNLVLAGGVKKLNMSPFMVGGQVEVEPPIYNAEGVEVEPAITVPVLSPHWDNLDGKGMHGDRMVQVIIKEVMRVGVHYVMVDMPPLPEPQDLAEEIELKSSPLYRPYWESIEAQDIVNWQTDSINGQTVPTLIVIKQANLESHGKYGQKEVCYYKEWRLVHEIEDPETGEKLAIMPVFSQRRRLASSRLYPPDSATTRITRG